MLIAKPSAYISEIAFSGGASFRFGKSEKVIVVGPNNSGKSEALREIQAICRSGDNNRLVVVKALTIVKSGSPEELQAFLDESAKVEDGVYRYNDWQIHASHVHFWSQPYLQHQLSAGFIRNISADERLKICAQQASIAPQEHKSCPQHILYDDPTLMERISGLFRKAFGKDIMFDFRGGSRLPIHVGEVPIGDEAVDRVSDAYVTAVRQNPLLDKQGDGMKAYAGILFEAVVANREITLIDEPEAFLHPPQMRRLGETLSSEVVGQLIVATHSSDILRGFLEGTRGDVRILRIRREGSVNIVSEAAPKIIKELWQKPELRYSSALDGIFHDQTIICEDDSDCRLINAVADHIAPGADIQWKDTAYVPAGGKHGIPKIASVLRKTGVPVKAVFDLDFLSERGVVEDAVVAFGGDWVAIEKMWARVDASVRKGIRAKTAAEIRQEVIQILEKAKEEQIPRSEIIDAMKQGKSWAEVKKFGAQAIPRGDAQKDYEILRDELEAIGIYLVPVGEMENFCPDVGGHGPKFVTRLLSQVPLDADRLGLLRLFVDRVHKGKHGVLGPQ